MKKPCLDKVVVATKQGRRIIISIYFYKKSVKRCP